MALKGDVLTCGECEFWESVTVETVEQEGGIGSSMSSVQKTDMLRSPFAQTVSAPVKLL